mgnify:CR=1 FL=1
MVARSMSYTRAQGFDLVWCRRCLTESLDRVSEYCETSPSALSIQGYLTTSAGTELYF